MSESKGIRVPVRLGLAVAVVIMSGCAGQGAQAVAWDASMAPLFSGDPGAPTGRDARAWTPQAEEQLMRRLGYADAVAVATVREVGRHDRYGSARFVSLAFHLREVLHGSLEGELDERRVLLLGIDEANARAFKSTVGQIRRLPQSRFLVFIKRTRDGEGKDRLRWAFYHPDRELLTRVRALYRDLEDKT